MANSSPVACQVRYTLDLTQLAAFEFYARTWIVLIERHGGIHHGYFIPRSSPDVAVAMFTFPSSESYRLYRERVVYDPECQSAAALVRETRCFSRYERLFLQPVQPLDGASSLAG